MTKDLFDLQGKVAVVTGGTTGLGYAIAIGLAEAGADVVPSSRRLEQVKKVAGEIEALGSALPADHERCAKPGFSASASRCRAEGIRQG